MITLVNKCRPHYLSINCRNVCSSTGSNLQECYRVLAVSPNSSLAEIRQAYLTKVKQYHPDSGSETADEEKFAQIDRSYKTLRKALHEQEEQQDFEENLEKDFGIKHVVPQHRQYLNYEGVGYGSPSQRQSQYQQFKVNRAMDTVQQRKIEKLASETENRLTFRDKQESKKHKISNAIDRLAEDLIQQAIAKGEFSNLKGFGKPLNTNNVNPYVDTVTQKINEILINEGFQPGWISLQKEINIEMTNLKNQMQMKRAKFGPGPLTNRDLAEWKKYLLQLEQNVKLLNAKIDSYNLIVPILNKQKVHFSLAKEACKFINETDVSK